MLSALYQGMIITSNYKREPWLKICHQEFYHYSLSDLHWLTAEWISKGLIHSKNTDLSLFQNVQTSSTAI
jgi:hypothetical protein